MPPRISNYPIFDANMMSNHNKVDGKIDDFMQGDTCDCWFLAAVKSLVQSKEGKECIKNSIRLNKDGSYSVFFQGDNSKKEYRFTQKEIDNANDLSSGDGDTRLLEMAARKYFESKHEKLENYGNGQKAYNLLIGKTHKTEEIIINGNRKMAKDRNGKIITGNKNIGTLQRKLAISEFAEKEIDKILKEKSANKALPVTVGVNYTPENKNLSNNHAYTVESVDYKNRTMTLINASYTVDRLTVSIDNFDKNFMDISIAEGFSQDTKPAKSLFFKIFNH